MSSTECDFCDEPSRVSYECKCGKYHNECPKHIRNHKQHSSANAWSGLKW